jgi:hypothetical protein
MLVLLSSCGNVLKCGGQKDLDATVQTPTRIIIIWRLRSRIHPALRQILNSRALVSSTHALDNRSQLPDSSATTVPFDEMYAHEFGFSTSGAVLERQRIWYQYLELIVKDLSAGLRVVFYKLDQVTVKVDVLRVAEAV